MRGSTPGRARRMTSGMTNTPLRYEELINTAARYGELAAENYMRIRSLAEAIQSGFCSYLNSPKPPCVLLVPPVGPFEPKAYGDAAFSAPPRGFQPLGPVRFGLAVRVSDKGDWVRIILSCFKEGETFTVDLADGGEHRFPLPLHEQDPMEFFGALHTHVLDFFRDAIDDYEHGGYGQREIGFDLLPAQDSAET